MDETTILLASSPGATGDFLATATPVSQPAEAGELPFEITLDGYTRDKWGRYEGDGRGAVWKTIFLRSVDGRGKLPGFLKFLNDRKKSAFGKFPTAESTEGLFVVPFDQPPPTPDVDTSGAEAKKHVMFCKYVLDKNKLAIQNSSTQQNHAVAVRVAPPHVLHQKLNTSLGTKKTGIAASNSDHKKQATPTLPPKPIASRGKSGFLSGILGAQKRTDAHLAAVPKSSIIKREDVNGDDDGRGLGSTGSGLPTSAMIMATFREQIASKLTLFQCDISKTVEKIHISLTEMLKQIDPTDMASRAAIKMDVLKYIVYEQAEELNDKWIAAKEPSEFMDECVVAVYKEGHAPPEILEEMMQGELPDEIKGQQRAIREAKMKELAKKEGKQDEKNLQNAIKEAHAEELAVLNTAKRDRRSIEEIQRDMVQQNKRARSS